MLIKIGNLLFAEWPDKSKSTFIPSFLISLITSKSFKSTISHQFVKWDFIFTVKFEVIPVFEIEDLSNMSIEDFEVEIDENDIDEVIKNIQKQHTKWQKTKEKAVVGDKIIIDYEALVDNKEFDGSKQKDFTFVLDDSIKGDVATVGLFQKFFKAVTNETTGSKIKFTYDIPNDFPDKNISGKKAEYNIFIKAIYKC